MQEIIRKKILRIKSYNNKLYGSITSIIALFFVVVELTNNSILPMIIRPLNPILQVALYGSFFIIIISSYSKLSFQPKTILLVLGTIMSLIVNDVDAKYGAGIRWILWILLLASAGPLLSSKTLLEIREKALGYFLKGFVIVTILSFLYDILGLPNIGRGNFAGLMNQSMVRGPGAAISGIYSFYNYLSSTYIKKKLFYLGLSGISVLVVILAASRLAFAGYIAGMIFLFARPFKFRIIYTFLILLMGTVVYTRIDDGVQDAKKSIDKGLVEKGTNNSREILWSDRINEFKSSPVFGVGFAAQDDYIAENEGGGMSGRVEPGSGYLMILSMTGAFGLFLFLWYFYFLFNSKRFWREIFKDETYKLSIFAFFAVHFIGEGYVYSAGSMLASLFWLLVGVTFPYMDVKKRKVSVKLINRRLEKV
jgi:O-antigen ligase